MKKELRIKVWKKYNHRCAYCGEELDYKEMQVDHIEAKHKGGKDDITNYNPSCRGCNFYKGTDTLEQFRSNLSTLHKRLNKIFIVRLAIRYGILKYKPFDGKFYFEKLNIPNVRYF